MHSKLLKSLLALKYHFNKIIFFINIYYNLIDFCVHISDLNKYTVFNIINAIAKDNFISIIVAYRFSCLIIL